MLRGVTQDTISDLNTHAGIAVICAHVLVLCNLFLVDILWHCSGTLFFGSRVSCPSCPKNTSPCGYINTIVTFKGQLYIGIMFCVNFTSVNFVSADRKRQQ